MSTFEKLDKARLKKVKALMERGASDGERAAARSRAESMAAAAGLSLDEALSSLDADPAPKQRSFFDGFDDWMDGREPGYKAREAAKRAEREARNARSRAELLKRHGTEAALFARTEWEVLLDAAVASFATWDYWVDDDGTQHRFAVTLDGVDREFGVWRKSPPPSVRLLLVRIRGRQRLRRLCKKLKRGTASAR